MVFAILLKTNGPLFYLFTSQLTSYDQDGICDTSFHYTALFRKPVNNAAGISLNFNQHNMNGHQLSSIATMCKHHEKSLGNIYKFNFKTSVI